MPRPEVDALPKVLLIGVGGLGAVILEFLARAPGRRSMVLAGRDIVRITARGNLATIGAMAQGCPPPDITCVPLDLRDEDATADTISRLQPDLIVSTATMQTWWLLDLLPPAAAAPLRRAGFGLWLPIHLALTLRLMSAVRRAGFGGQVITAPFPDVVNPVLACLGLAPTCGIGNLDEIVPKLRLLAAARLQAPVATIKVSLVAHHALEPHAFGEPGELPPWFMRVARDGQDVTELLDGEALLRASYPITEGVAGHFLTAGSAVRLIQALLEEDETFLHAPAPGGLPGGYPVLVGRSGVRPAPIAGLSLEEAIQINKRSHPFDGIERIEPDGTVTFRPSTIEASRSVLGYPCDPLRPGEAEDRALELMERFTRYAGRHGVVLPAQ